MLEAELDKYAPVIITSTGVVARVKPTRRENVFLDKSYFGDSIRISREAFEYALKAALAGGAYSGVDAIIYIGGKRWMYVVANWVWNGMRFVEGRPITREKLLQYIARV